MSIPDTQFALGPIPCDAGCTINFDIELPDYSRGSFKYAGLYGGETDFIIYLYFVFMPNVGVGYSCCSIRAGFPITTGVKFHLNPKTFKPKNAEPVLKVDAKVFFKATLLKIITINADFGTWNII